MESPCFAYPSVAMIYTVCTESVMTLLPEHGVAAAVRLLDLVVGCHLCSYIFIGPTSEVALTRRCRVVVARISDVCVCVCVFTRGDRTIPPASICV